MSSSTEVEEVSSCGKSECFAPTPLSRRSSDLGSRRGSDQDSRYSISRKQSVVGNKKQGWMRLKNRFTNKSEGFYFELDSLSEYVQYYRYEHSVTKDVTKNRIIGSFNVEGAFLSSEDRVTKKDEKYRIIVRTKRGRKYVLTVSTKTDRDEWKNAMERARDQARSPEAMLAEWNQQDECVRCILPDQINEESIENEIVAAEEDDIQSVTTASMTSTLAGEYPEYFSMYIQDMDGKKVQLRNVLTSKVNVLVMLRQFGCKLCRHAAGRLMAAKPLFDALGVNLVAVGNGSAEAAKAFAKEFKFQGKLYADEKRELYKALSCNQGFRYILFKKTIEAIYNAHKEGYRQGEPTGDELQLGGAFVVSANGEMIHRQIERFAGEPLDVPVVVSQCKSFLESCDKWSTKPIVPRNWEDVEDVFADQKLLKIPGTFTEDSLESTQRFHFEFGNPEVTPNVEIIPQIAYFNDNFFGKSSVTYLSSEPEEPTIGPICITIEKVGRSDRKAIIRTVEGDIRALIPVEHSSEKDALKWLKLQHSMLDKVILSEVSSTALQEDLLEYENKFIYSAYKFGVLYAKDGQTENEIFQNGKGSEDFDDFLQMLGKKVLLRGFKHYKGGLDTKHDSSGSHSYFTNFKGNEVMFHVSTLLPNNEKDAQRVEKKRHIGNDVVVLIFKEGNEPFDPAILNSQFNHVFLVVRPEKDKHGKTQFRIATAAKSGVEPFEPYIGTSTYHKSEKFRDFLLTKMINGERTATQIQEFKRRETRTRRDLLREFVTTYNPQSSKSFSAFLKKIPSSYLQPVSQEKVKTPRVKELEKDENFKKLEGVAGAAQRAMGLYTVHEDDDDKVNLDAVLKVFKEIREISDEKNLETTGAVKTITVRRFGKRGACEIIKPSSFEQLLADGGKVLSMTATKARTIAMEEEIVDIGKIADDEVIFLTSAEEEANYFGGGLSASQST